MIRDLLEQANDIQTKLNLLKKAQEEMKNFSNKENLIFHDAMPPISGLDGGRPESATVKNTRALRRLMELLK